MQLFEGFWKMSEWAEVPLGELVDIFDNRRVPLSSTERMMRQGPFPYYGAQGVIDHIDDYIFDGRYILVPEDGENLRSRKSPIAYFAEGRFWVNNHAHIIKAKPHVAVDRFVQSALQATNIDRWVTGAAQPKLSQRNLKQIPIRIPSREVQQTIAAILDTFDDLIENNRRRVELLEEMARTIYREWFVKFRYPGHEDVPMVDSALGPIPEGWGVSAASAIVEVNPRIKPDKSIEHPLITMSDLDERTMVCCPSGVRAGGSGAKFQQGDTLFARITPCLQNGKTGLVQFLAEDEVGLGSTEFVVLRGRLVGSVFTYCLARDDRFRGHAIASMSGASGRQRVRNECFDSYPLATPPKCLAKAFEDTAGPLISQIQILFNKSMRLEALRDTLLPKLVTGQIDVSTLDLDSLTLTDSFGNDEVA